MSTRAADYMEAIERLPDGATLVIHQVDWDDYESLLEDVSGWPRLRVSYDCGRLEIMSPLQRIPRDFRKPVLLPVDAKDAG